MPALRHDVDLFTLAGDRLALGEDRRRRLDREPDNQGIAVGDPAQNTAGIVAQEDGPADIIKADLVCIVFTGQACGIEPVADLNPLTALIDIIAAARSVSSLP